VKILASIIFLKLALVIAAFAPFMAYNTSGTTAFTPLHTYYMAASGCNDANAGTSAGSPWCTPNHAVVCGDVIIAASGTYNGDFATWGTVSTCPSVSGGIDGAGGVYAAILLCGGTDLGSGGCQINCSTGACNAGHVGSGGSAAKSSGMNVNQSNWAVEGWTINGNGASHRGFQVDSCLTTTTVIHHVFFINDIAYNAAQGYDTNDCGYNHNTNGNGTDYWGVVGSIAQNAAQDTICLGAVDLVAPSNSDTNAGTHAFIYGNFSYNNLVTCASDGEDYMADTLDAHGWVGTAAFINNIGWSAQRYGLQVFYQAKNVGTTSTVVDVYNDTMYHNNIGGTASSSLGEFNIQSTVSALPWAITVQNNVGYSDFAHGTAGSTAVNYALAVGGSYANTTIGGSGPQNVFGGVAGTCGASCDGGDNVIAFNGGSFGTNTYESPAFNNTTDLLNNQTGAPSCTGFVTVTACMGYNAASQSLTNPSVIYDLRPTAAGTSGKGYQLPSTTCSSITDYPSWLKGIVYLHWTGAAVVQQKDLVTVPCGL
jgi:hypothetical protein